MAGFVIYISHLIFIYCRYNLLFHSLTHYIGIRLFSLSFISWMFVVLLHNFSLFSYALSRVASNGRIITEYQIGNDTKGGCSLTWGPTHYCIGMTEKNKEKLWSWYLVSNLRSEHRISCKIRVPFNCIMAAYISENPIKYWPDERIPYPIKFCIKTALK